jgi:hypothetical protein
MTANHDVTDPAVQALIAAINAGDRAVPDRRLPQRHVGRDADALGLHRHRR